MSYITIDDRNRLETLRKRAAPGGLRVSSTSRWRYHTIDNLGGVLLIDAYSNTVVEGDRFSLSLDDVERILNEHAQEASE